MPAGLPGAIGEVDVDGIGDDESGVILARSSAHSEAFEDGAKSGDGSDEEAAAASSYSLPVPAPRMRSEGKPGAVLRGW